MMYDRPYMKTSHEEQAKRTLLWIIGITVAVYVLQRLFQVSGAENFFETYFAFNSQSLSRGFIWAPVTYAFLHAPGIMHILVNMLMVFFLGRAVFAELGQKRFLQLYLATAVTGGFAWYAASFASGSTLVIGTSAAGFGLLAFFAALYPNREIQVLLFFIIPVRVKPKILAYIALGISLLGLLNELFEGSAMSGVAHSAHLGGMAAGYLFYRFVYLANPYDNSGELKLSVPKIFKKPAPKKSSAGYRYNVNVETPRDLKNEVDRILDKINSKGFGSLSAQEKKVLDEARDLLRKR